MLIVYKHEQIDRTTDLENRERRIERNMIGYGVRDAREMSGTAVGVREAKPNHLGSDCMYIHVAIRPLIAF